MKTKVKISMAVKEQSADKAYYIFKKPSKCLSTMNDLTERNSVGKMFSVDGEKLFLANRLPFETEGLVILTNDSRVTNIHRHVSFNENNPLSIELTEGEAAKLTVDEIEAFISIYSKKVA